jgi:hypothetical protein
VTALGELHAGLERRVDPRMIRVPLDKTTVLEPGVAYTIELHGMSDEPVAHVRHWRVGDEAAPVTVEKETEATYVELKYLPEP